jgi:hypothetical protein
VGRRLVRVPPDKTGAALARQRNRVTLALERGACAASAVVAVNHVYREGPEKFGLYKDSVDVMTGAPTFTLQSTPSGERLDRNIIRGTMKSKPRGAHAFVTASPVGGSGFGYAGKIEEAGWGTTPAYHTFRNAAAEVESNAAAMIAAQAEAEAQEVA